jgi:hypothetical protein
MRSARCTLVLLAGVLVAPAPVRSRPAARVPVRATTNDNRLPAGVLKDGTLSIHLVAQMVAWHPEAEDGPFKVVEAFGEPGRAPSIPGPLLRFPLGTTIDASITNSLPDTLVVLGVGGRDDSLRIAPTQTRRVRYTPPAAGSFLYRAGVVRGGALHASGTHGQLVGGLIVDPGPAAPRDRVFITTGWDPNPYSSR